VTSVEKVERGIRPGRCADVTLGWRAETGRQVVVGHTRTHTRTYARTGTYTCKQVEPSARCLSRDRSLPVPRFLSFSLFFFFPFPFDARGDSHGGIERAQAAGWDERCRESKFRAVDIDCHVVRVNTWSTTWIRLAGSRYALFRYDPTIARAFFFVLVAVVGPRACVAAKTRRLYTCASRVCVRAYTRASMKRLSPPSCRKEV